MERREYDLPDSLKPFLRMYELEGRQEERSSAPLMTEGWTFDEERTFVQKTFFETLGDLQADLETTPKDEAEAVLRLTPLPPTFRTPDRTFVHLISSLEIKLLSTLVRIPYSEQPHISQMSPKVLTAAHQNFIRTNLLRRPELEEELIGGRMSLLTFEKLAFRKLLFEYLNIRDESLQEYDIIECAFAPEDLREKLTFVFVEPNSLIPLEVFIGETVEHFPEVISSGIPLQYWEGIIPPDKLRVNFSALNPHLAKYDKCPRAYQHLLFRQTPQGPKYRQDFVFGPLLEHATFKVLAGGIDYTLILLGFKYFDQDTDKKWDPDLGEGHLKLMLNGLEGIPIRAIDSTTLLAFVQ